MTEQRPFQTLQEALEFLVECLEAEDFERVGAECPKLAEVGASDYGYHALKALREKHLETSLLGRYRGQRFPRLHKTLKLGGHDAELGHLHIDFTRTSAGWVFEHIWICR